MTPEQYERAQQLFEDVEPLPPGSRAARLAELCPDDDDLRRRVLELLASGSDHVDAVHERIRDTLLTQPGSRVGPYRLVRLLGEGGMGEVWLAEQLEPIRRQVALKLIKPGMDTRRVVARFEAERQALGLMDHPTIAHIYDAGVTERGLPYFAMEFVDGLQITNFCDEHLLTVDDRLRLFLRVCEGVQHAHQKTVIHRDLKPSNVLVRMQDGRPHPTIIDFGVAKALQEPLGARAMLTEFGLLVGTPEYMGPERLGVDGGPADTRTDVYALGMILFELLVGALPVDVASLRTSDQNKLRRALAERSLRAPSTMLRDSGNADEVARLRSTDARRLEEALRGDLDWIVMKATATEVDARYASVALLAEDVGNYLEARPVSARPPSLAYLATRFVRRHRLAVAVAAAIAALLIAGTVGTTIGLLRAREAEATARREAAAAEQSLGFLLNLFRATNPFTGGSPDLTARQMLDSAAKQLGSDADLDPVARARLKQAVGYSYLVAFDVPKSERLLNEALKEQRSELGEDHVQTLRTLQYLAELYWTVGPLDKAEQMATAAAGGFRRKLGPDDPATLEADSLLVDVLTRRGRDDEALPIAEDVLRRSRVLLGPRSLKTSDAMDRLAALLLKRGDIDGAEKLDREALAIRSAALGPDHVTTLASELALANVAMARGDLASAEKTRRRAVSIIERQWGPTTKPAYRMHEQLGNVLSAGKRWREARAELEHALEGYRRLLTPGHPDILSVAHNLAVAEEALGETSPAVALFREACDGRREQFGATHPLTQESCTALEQLVRPRS